EEQVALREHLRILETCQVVVRRKLEDSFEEQLRVVENVAFQSNTGQQTHSLDVITVPAEIIADELFGRRDLAVGEQRRRRYYLGRQFSQRRHVISRLLGFLRLTRHPIEALEQAPARGKGRIDVDRTQKGVDRLGSLPQRDMAVSALLVQAAEARVEALQRRERVERGGDITRDALRNRPQIEEVTILRHREQERVGRTHGSRRLPLLEQLAYALNFLLHLVEIVSERDSDHPRPQRCLLDDELVGAGESAGVGIGQILAMHVDVPVTPGNPNGCVESGVGGILEAAPRGRDRPAHADLGVRACLRDRVCGVPDPDLDVGNVIAGHPVIARTQAELHGRRVGAGGADRPEGVRYRDASAGAADLRDRLTEIRRVRGVVVDQGRGVGLAALVPVSRALHGEPGHDAGHEGGLDALDEEVLTVGVVEDIADHAGIEELDLHVGPLVVIHRAVPLQPVVEELGLPADLVVREVVGRIRPWNHILWRAVWADTVQGAAVLVEASRTKALGEGVIHHYVRTRVPGEVGAYPFTVLRVGQALRVEVGARAGLAAAGRRASLETAEAREDAARFGVEEAEM